VPSTIASWMGSTLGKRSEREQTLQSFSINA
jgi:hypothetical protein